MDSKTGFRPGRRQFHFLGKPLAWLQAAAFALCAPLAHAATTPGTAPGQFSVSPTGAATYQMSIPVPPGVNGLKPSLALLYNSQAGNGLLGQGWSLSGLSVISHCPQTIDQDGVAALPTDSSTDRLCLDGQRLILVGGSYGAAGSTYRTEIDSFRLVTLSQVTSGVPTVFTVVDRSGLTSTYGGTNYEVGGGNGTPLLWLVSSITDRYNNFIDFSYSISNYNAQNLTTSWDKVTRITYGNAQNAVVGKVIFTYTNTTRADSFNQFFAFTQVTVNPTELTNITVEDGAGNVLNTFTLGYQNSNPQQLTTSPTELKSVQECGSDGTCYPATTFNYQGAPFALNTGGNPITPTGAINGYQVADFDGDGIPDYVFSSGANIYVVFGNNTSVSYQVPNVALNSSNGPGISLIGTVTADLNGDGRQEMLVPYYPNPGGSNNPVWWVLQWNGQQGSKASLTAGQAPTTNGNPLPMPCITVQTSCIADAVAVDTQHAGQPSLFFASPDGYFYYYANVGGKLSTTATPAHSPVNLTYMNDGNGVPPKLTPFSWAGTAAIYVSGQNIGYSGVIGWSQSQRQFTPFMSGDNAQATQVIPFYPNGDGYPAAAAIEISNWCYVANTGGGFDTSNVNNYSVCVAQPSGADDTNVQTVDWYGDGRQELIVPVNGTWYMFVPTTYTASFVSTGVSVPAYDNGTQMHFLDTNGDGQPDLVYTYNGHTEFLYNSFTPYLISLITDGLGHNTQVGYVPMGAEVRGAYVNNANFVPPPVNPPQTRLYSGAMSIVKDFAVDTGTFDSSRNPQQIYTYYLYGGAAIEQWGRGFLGFSQVQAINFNTGVFTTDTYRQDFPFTGMVATSTKTWNSQATLQSIYVPSGTGAGVHVSCTAGNPAEPSCEIVNAPEPPSVSFLNGGAKVSATTNSYLEAYEPGNPTNPNRRLYTGVYSPYQSSSTTSLYDIGPGNALYETTTTGSTYQVVSTAAGASGVGPTGGSLNIGADVMPTDITVSTSDPNNSSDNETVDTQTPVTAYTWEATCPGHPGTVTVIHSSPALTNGLTQTETFTYDGKCFLTQDVKNIIDPAGSSGYPKTLTKAFTPDSYGNPLTSTVTPSDAAARTTTMVYDPTERFPTTITNALQQAETLAYDSWGNKLADTDANGNTVIYKYDGFERKISQSGPLPDVSSTWTYGACGGNCINSAVPNAVAYQVTQTGSDGSSATTEYDELGRTVRNWHVGFAGTAETINQDTQYDLMGRVAMTSAPYLSSATPCWDVKNHDVLNRVSVEYQPMNSSQCGGSASATTGSPERTIGTSYSGLVTTRTVSDPSGKTPIASEKTVTTLNVLGKPASVQDQGGQSGAQVETDYGYDVWGNLTSVTPPPAQPNGPRPKVSMAYDSIGDKLGMQDPDMGSWVYTYDALGELLTQTDAKGQTVTNQYDLLGRLTDRQEAEGETRWVYDIGYGAGIGKLAYTEGPGGVWEGYAYDGFGEATDKITVVGGQEYWVTNTYDDQGRVSQVVYPNMTAVNVNSTPAQPASLSVAMDPNNGAAYDLTWPLASNALQGQIFHLYRTPSSVTAVINTTVPSQYEIYSGPVPNWQDTTITTNDTYTWWIQACNDTACSGYAESQPMAVTLPPTVPGSPQYLGDSHQRTVTLTWLASKSRGGTTGPITYNVTAVFTPWGASTPTSTTPAASGVADTGTAYASANVTLSQDGAYAFSVQACEGTPSVCSAYGGTFTYSTVLTPSVPGTPSVPAIVTPQTSPAGIGVSWAGSSFAGGPVNYELRVENTLVTGAAFADTHTQPGSATSVTDTQTQDGKYLYQVRACDTNEAGVCSTYVQASGPAAVTLPPMAPGIPTVPTYDQNAPTWQLTWVPSPPLTSGSTALINYYVVQYWSGASGFTNVTGPQTFSAGVMNLIAKAIPQGGYFQNGTYTYAVEACTTDTAVSSTAACTKFTPTSNAYTTTIAPGVIPSVNVPSQSSGNGSFTVTYSVPPANNTAGIITGYNVQVYDDVCTDPPNPVCHTVPEATCTPSPATATTCTFAANSLPAGQNGYGLQVRANDNGVHGPWFQTSAPTIVYTPTPAAPTLSIASLNNNGGYTLSWNAPAYATSYQLSFSHETNKAGATWSAWTVVYTGSATTYTTVSGLQQYYLSYKVIACNVYNACSGASSVLEFENPQEPGGCMTCIKINGDQPTPAPAPGSSASAVPAVSSGILLPAKPALAMAPSVTHVTAPGLQLPALRALAMNAATLPRPGSLRRLALARPHVSAAVKSHRFAALAHARTHTPQMLAVASLSPRQAYFLSHATQTTAPKPRHMRKRRPAEQPVVAAARYMPPEDPILSLYPPLRVDPRVLAHYVARGGVLPAEVQNVDAVCGGTSTSCTEPDGGTALMVGYVYNSNGYLAKVEKLNAAGTAIGELWQAAHETAFGQVDQQVFDATEGNTSGALSVNDNYDPGTGILDGTSASAAATTGGATSLSAGYTWDGYNNLLARSLSEAVPAGQTGASALTESFTYDAVNRMTQVTDSAGNKTGMAYDSVGSIQSNGVYTGYQYGSPNTGLCGTSSFSPAHAVSGLSANGTARSFCYDANGNMTAESGDVTRSPINWTSYNKPSAITSTIGGNNTVTETFVYGPSRERLQTTVNNSGGSSVTTTYIDGLFEQVQDNAGNVTYKHYIMAGSARVGVETITTSNGTMGSDLMSFFVGDQVDGVIAGVTEGLYGANQQVTVYGHDHWGKARPTSGTGANLALLPGVFQPASAVMAGQHEGFARHEDLEDIGIVEMEGRAYDPETGRFLSADPTVQFPGSSQGYNRYTYVNNNPLSLSDPTGYTSEANRRWEGGIAAIAVAWACSACAPEVEAMLAGAADGYVSSGGTWSGTALGGMEAMAFAAVGASYGPNPEGTDLLERSLTEGLIGGAFTSAGGGSFGDGFLGAFASSAASEEIEKVYTGNNYYSPINVAARTVLSAVVGGTVSKLFGGDFADGAMAAAFQRLFNDETAGADGRSIAFSHGTTVTIIHPDGSVEVRSGDIPQRANNPGDIRPGSWASRHGAIGETWSQKYGAFAVFPDMATGWKAMDAQLHSSDYINLTVNDAIARRSPPQENNTKQLQIDISTWSGLGGNTILNSLNSSQFGSFENAIGRSEGMLQAPTVYLASPMSPYIRN